MDKNIENYLPHRYPFLFVDKIISVNKEEKSGIFQKNVSHNESYFVGHFPQEKVMPGVIQIEAMAQSFIILIKALGYKFDILYFAKINDATFKQIVRPGDVLTLSVKLKKAKMNIFIGEGQITNQNNELVGFGTMTAGAKVSE
jgi:beta-hydroxyacyl-ACP dehydratase FabZ